MSGFRLRPFEPGDFALEGIPAEHRSSTPSFGLTALRADGSVAGYGGIRWIGNEAWMFFYGGDGMRQPFWLHRLTVRWLNAADALGISPIHALCDDRYPRAAEWLAALGFKRTSGDVNGMGVWTR